ncbi:hypothetical protein [Pelagibius sp.]|uniref:hypothetical protein n=1 Tax=Pelagibius sp. TaxID=1931238 RepID=UPI003BB07940
MRIQKTKTLFGLAASALVALTMSMTFHGAAEADVSKSPTMKMQVQKKPIVPPRPTGPQASNRIQSKPVVIKDHAWVQFWDTITGEDTGCHDIDNQTSCSGTCPCN